MINFNVQEFIKILAVVQMLVTIFLGGKILGHVLANRDQHYRLWVLASFILGTLVNIQATVSGAHDNTWRIFASLIFWFGMDIGLYDIYVQLKKELKENGIKKNAN